VYLKYTLLVEYLVESIYKIDLNYKIGLVDNEGLVDAFREGLHLLKWHTFTIRISLQVSEVELQNIYCT